jgi:rSAM/selenodomain-associated transferase 1
MSTPPLIDIAVFARAPVAGAVKTRLIPLLGADGAAELHARLVDSTLQRAAGVRAARVTLWVAGDAAHSFIADCAARHRCAVRAQVGNDLGARMHHAFERTLAADDAAGCVLIGTDCPALASALLQGAVAALRTHDAVLGPALDGGYVLIGLTRPRAALFEGIAWGSDSVLAATRARIAQAGLRHHELPPLPDLDTPEDYRRAQAAGLL